jgi:histidinol-phosphate phosphatase family protein
MSEMKKKCVFLDRDGIVNTRVMDGYVESWDGFELLPEFPELLRKVSAMGYVAVVITNQRGVARGIMSRQAVDDIHANLKAMLEHDFGLHLLDVMLCPHERDSCTCRKPQPKMILDAAAKHGIDLALSWMIGDTESDVEAGRRAGCRTILVSDEALETVASARVASMRELVWRIEELLEG